MGSDRWKNKDEKRPSEATVSCKNCGAHEGQRHLKGCVGDGGGVVTHWWNEQQRIQQLTDQLVSATEQARQAYEDAARLASELAVTRAALRRRELAERYQIEQL